MERKWLKKIRKEQGKTQEEMSVILGISRSHYASIEKGSKNPSIDLAEKISDILGCDFNNFKKSTL